MRAAQTCGWPPPPVSTKTGMGLGWLAVLSSSHNGLGAVSVRPDMIVAS